MRSRKLFLLSAIAFCSLLNIQFSKPYTAEWVITKGCSLKVDGKTNVNKFSCLIADYSEPETLTFKKANATGSIAMSGRLTLPVQNFDCHNPMMTKDLRKSLKAKEFPNLTIRFISLNKYPDFNRGQDTLDGLVSIELAGVTKRFTIHYTFIPEGDDSLTLIGTRKVYFSDFNIVPPRKLGGMIQTSNDLNVEFNLNIKVQNH